MCPFPTKLQKDIEKLQAMLTGTHPNRMRTPHPSLPFILTRKNRTELGRATPGPKVHHTPIFWDRLPDIGVGAGSKQI